MKNIVVFASGSGSNFQAIIEATKSGIIQARIAGLVSNKDGIGALEKAEAYEIPSVVINPDEFISTAQYADSLIEQLEFWDTDLIALAGYLRKIPAEVIQRFPNRILNIHPSLLPKYGGQGFYGMKVHRAVLNNGEEKSGCTVHIVTEIYDDGPILGQESVVVSVNDTPEDLARKVLEQEHKLYPRIIQQHLESLKD